MDGNLFHLYLEKKLFGILAMETYRDIEWHSIITVAETCDHWVKLEPGTQLNVMKRHRDEIIEKGWGKDDVL